MLILTLKWGKCDLPHEIHGGKESVCHKELLLTSAVTNEDITTSVIVMNQDLS